MFYNEQDQVLFAHREDIGIETNNTAEYRAVMKAYELLINVLVPQYSISAVEWHADSLLVVQQLKGVYKIKQAHIQEYVDKIREYERELGLPVSYTHVMREKNKLADALVNDAVNIAELMRK
ncbi:MAG: bifunctional RNase H/acid phosphatase [Microgenomates bacterium OLB23]|nr:MAG: bifunctional RNase H/acid phosphatase [Microgenomates bacterium OLB23]